MKNNNCRVDALDVKQRERRKRSKIGVEMQKCGCELLALMMMAEEMICWFASSVWPCRSLGLVHSLLVLLGLQDLTRLLSSFAVCCLFSFSCWLQVS